VLELLRVENMTAFVQPAKSPKGVVPRWGGGRMPLSSELAEAVRALLEDHVERRSSEPEMRGVARLLALQQAWSRVPRRSELLIEQVETREGHHLFCYPFEGRQVHTGMAALLGYRLSRTRPASFSFAVNDYGFELLSRGRFELLALLKAGWLSPGNLLDDVLASLNAAELTRRQFREVARVAGLVFTGFPGANKTVRQLQATSGLIYDVFARWDAGNPLLGQARDEVLSRELEFSRLAQAMERIAGISIVIRQTGRPTPFAFPLMVERLRESLTSERLADRVKRMQVEFDEAAPVADGLYAY
jgi:ATP-dependent Lhr-like helicase